MRGTLSSLAWTCTRDAVRGQRRGSGAWRHASQTRAALSCHSHGQQAAKRRSPTKAGSHGKGQNHGQHPHVSERNGATPRTAREPWESPGPRSGSCGLRMRGVT